MKQKLLHIICAWLIFFLSWAFVFAGWNNLEIQWQRDAGKDRIKKLETIATSENGDKFFNTWTLWEKWVNNLFINIARDIKNVIFIFATIIMFVLVFRLLFAENSEEEAGKFKSGIIWIAVWIVIMQISFVFYRVMFDQWADGWTAYDLSKAILEPFTNLLMMGASFVFIAVAIYAFYKIVTANGDDEAVSKGKMTIVYGLIGFVVIKLADVLVRSTYGVNECKWRLSGNLLHLNPQWCIEAPKLEWAMGIITTLINWLNGFLWIIIVLLIIYAWFLVLTWGWDEEKTSKAKNIIFYAFIWLLVLIMSYLLLTFFILPEAPIIPQNP